MKNVLLVNDTTLKAVSTSNLLPVFVYTNKFIEVKNRRYNWVNKER